MGLNYPNGDPNMSSTPIGGNIKPVQAMDQMATNSAKIAQGMLNMEHSLQRSLTYMQKLSAAWKTANGGSNSSPLLNDSTNADTSSVLGRLKTSITNKIYGVDPNSQSQQLISKMQSEINQQIPVPKAMATRIGGGLASLAAIGSGMMPYTNDAVTQRMLTQGVGSMIDMDPNKITAMSNKMLAGGITGAYSAQAATSILASQGILPTMGGFSNIMGSTGGLSVLTGMSNEQTAQAWGGINGMNFLRVGVRARDSKGNLRAPEEIANDLYRRTFGNRKLTEAQAAQVFNQNSRSYQGIMAVAGGNADLAAQLQEMMYYQGKGGGKKLNVKDAQNVKDNILNLRKDDPSRAMWNYQGSEANKLQATGNGLVGGYSAALDATASVNNGMAALANMLPGVTNAFGNLKGFLDTLPTAGGTGATMAGGITSGVGHFGAMLAMNRMAKGLTATETALTGEAAAGGALATGGGTAALAAKLSGGGAISRTLGSGLTSIAAKGGMTLGRAIPALAAGGVTYYGMSKIQNRLQQYGRDHHLNGALQATGNEAFNTAKFAASGAAMGATLGGAPGALAGLVAGTAFGVAHMGYDALTGNWGRGAVGGDASITAGTVGSTTLRSTLSRAGFGPHALPVAYAVAMAESGGRPRAHNTNASTGDNSYGLFQINMIGNMGPNRRQQFHLKSNNDLFDPLTNAKAAYAISNKGRDWGPWSTYKNGAYKKYLNDTNDVKFNRSNLVNNNVSAINDTKSDLPRNAREAASWALQQVKNGSDRWHNYCERFVETAWGKPHRYASAIAHWGVAVREKRAHNGKDAPPGAFVFWGGGQYGHTAISIGGGKVVSTDILRKGKADVVHIDTITKRWNKPYLGWADPSKGTVLDKNSTPINATNSSELPPTSAKSSESLTSSEATMPWYQRALNSVSSVFGSQSSSSAQSAGSSVAVASQAIGMASVASTASLLGFGSSTGSDYAGSEININMTVNIGSSSRVDIQTLAREIKTAIDKEMRNEKIRGF